MLRKLTFHTPWLVILVPLCAAPLLAQVVNPQANPAPGASPSALVVLQNGEVLEGDVVPAGERVRVTLPGREISLRSGDVDVVARTLTEAYELKRAKVRPTDVGGRLDLAAWCLRHNLLASAGEELAAAAQVQPFEPRLKALQRRLEKSLEGQAMAVRASYNHTTPSIAPAMGKAMTSPATKSGAEVERSDTSRLWPPVAAPRTAIVKPAAKQPGVRQEHKTGRDILGADAPAALERFVRSLPARAVEDFTNSLHPMISRSCATAGCHAPGNPTEFTLLRLPPTRAASRRLTQRNLYNTVQLVDFTKPEESRLLKVASQPHGPLKAGVFGDQRSPKYRELAAWVSGLTGVTIDRDEPANVETTPAIAWDRLQRSADRSVVSDQARLEAVLDQLEPNRPAEIRPAPDRVAPAKTSKTAGPGSRSNITQKGYRD